MLKYTNNKIAYIGETDSVYINSLRMYYEKVYYNFQEILSNDLLIIGKFYNSSENSNNYKYIVFKKNSESNNVEEIKDYLNDKDFFTKKSNFNGVDIFSKNNEKESINLQYKNYTYEFNKETLWKALKLTFENTEPIYYKNNCRVRFKTMYPMLYNEIIQMNVENSIFKSKFDKHLDKLSYDKLIFKKYLSSVIKDSIKPERQQKI